MQKTQRNTANAEYKGPPMADLERLYMPAMPPLGLFRAIARWAGWLKRRRDLRRLLRYEDRLLQDIGHDREAIRRALRTPTTEDVVRAVSRGHGAGG